MISAKLSDTDVSLVTSPTRLRRCRHASPPPPPSRGGGLGGGGPPASPSANECAEAPPPPAPPPPRATRAEGGEKKQFVDWSPPGSREARPDGRLRRNPPSWQLRGHDPSYD